MSSVTKPKPIDARTLLETAELSKTAGNTTLAVEPDRIVIIRKERTGTSKVPFSRAEWDQLVRWYVGGK